MSQAERSSDAGALALAGIVQAAALVHETAAGRSVPEAPREALLNTVPTRNARDLEEIFPDPGDFALGAELASEALRGKARAPEVLRYTLQLIELAGMLRRVPQLTEKLGRLLDGVDPQNPDESRLADIYQKTISTLGKRIQVTGDPQALQQEQTAERIRALLLAGVRLAWLWQQLGGRRWHLLLRRRALLESLRGLSRTAVTRDDS